MDNSELLDSLRRWRDAYFRLREEIVDRDDLPTMPTERLGLALSGVRRCGKTSTAIQLSKNFSRDSVLYYNFEDPLFLSSESSQDTEQLIRLYEEERGGPPELVILDEIQNVIGWERWVRTFIDQRRAPVIVTGSNAKLLSAELSSSLTGRTIESVVWPLSLTELKRFIDYRSHNQNNPEQILDVSIPFCLKYMLSWGTMPGATLIVDESAREELLKQYVSDIVNRDIISRHEIRNKRALDQIHTFYQTNISSLHSFSALKKAFGIPTDTAADYTQALSDAFLIFTVERYHHNLKVQSRDARKVYSIDPGIRRVSARSISADIGKLLENLVYLELRRRKQTVHYYSNKGEVDFVITRNYEPVAAIQVCAYGLENKETRDREVNALVSCLEDLELRGGTIVAIDREESLVVNGKEIEIIPATKWLTETN